MTRDLTLGGGPNDDFAVEEGGGIRLRDLDFTDLYMSESGIFRIRGADDENGPLTDVPDNLISDIDVLHFNIFARAQKGEKEFMIDFDEVRYRASRINAMDGVWYTLRKSKLVVPRIRELRIPLPIVRQLAWYGRRHGLILIAGATGNGKTTTAYSILNEYLLAFGDIAVTIEDPPEMILNGRRGASGHCFQLRLEEGQSFGSALVSAMRYTPRYIFIGELRKPADANQALRAAISGHLVITTIHAGSVTEAISSIIKLSSSGGEESLEFSRDQLANGLAGVIHQKLLRPSRPGGERRLKMETLFFGEDNGVRSLIRDGQTNQLGTAIAQQASRIARGDMPVDVNKKG